MVQGLPHDVYTILPYSRPLWLNILLAGMIIATLSFLLYGLVRWYRRRPKKSIVTTPKSPWELLVEELLKWELQADFKTPREGREFFYGLSLTLRKGIELAFNIPATDLTLKEIKLRLRSDQNIDAVKMKELFGFLDRADMIKFADAPTNTEEAKKSLMLVKEWLGDMKPKPIQPLPSEGMQSGKSKGLL